MHTRVDFCGIFFQFRYTEFGLETSDETVKTRSRKDFQFRYTEFGLETFNSKVQPVLFTNFQFRYTEFGLETLRGLGARLRVDKLSIPLYGIWS